MPVMLSYLQTLFTSVLDTHHGIKLHVILCQLHAQFQAFGGSFCSYFRFKKKSKTEWFELQNHIRNDAIHPQKIWESRTVHFSQEQREGLWFVPKQEAVIGS